MLENMQICRTPAMAAEKERSRGIGDSKLFANSNKEGNHERSEDKAIIDQSVEFIYRFFELNISK
jgi:hypothetical protein